MGLCTLLTIANAVLHRRRARFARNPCSFRWSRTPWPPTSCARIPWRNFRWLDLSEEDTPLPVFALNLSVPELAQASLLIPRLAGDSRRHLGESSLAACCGVHATPVGKARQRLPAASILRRDPTERWHKSGTDEPLDSSSPEGAGTVSSRTPVPLWASFQTCRS